MARLTGLAMLALFVGMVAAQSPSPPLPVPATTTTPATTAPGAISGPPGNRRAGPAAAPVPTETEAPKETNPPETNPPTNPSAKPAAKPAPVKPNEEEAATGAESSAYKAALEHVKEGANAAVDTNAKAFIGRIDCFTSEGRIRALWVNADEKICQNEDYDWVSLIVPPNGRVTSVRESFDKETGLLSKLEMVMEAPDTGKITFECGGDAVEKAFGVEALAKGAVLSEIKKDGDACSADGVDPTKIVIVGVGKGADAVDDNNECHKPGSGGVVPPPKDDFFLSNWIEGDYSSNANSLPVGEASGSNDKSAALTFTVDPSKDALIKFIKVPLKVNPNNVVGQCRLSVRKTVNGLPTEDEIGFFLATGLTKDVSVAKWQPATPLPLNKGEKYAFVINQCTQPGKWTGSTGAVVFTTAGVTKGSYLEKNGNSGWNVVQSGKEPSIFMSSSVPSA